ncbi:uncharacterized protein LOC103988202 isoform X1 [Musa acuminata AAA Group]|uniref:uncharacterized protein LOC103988202 isoform X1 n=2 Tax=Musa acuminata AAA Group TaxID=214697 RepID=UPI0031DE1783
MPLGLKSQVNGKRHNFGEANMSISLLPNHEGKALDRLSDRKLSNCSYFKRARIDQPESSTRNVRVDDGITVFQKNAELLRSTSADKARMIKPKRGLDGKRNDRKNFRSGIKTRYDSFTSKSGFASSDSNCGGNNLLGLYGLRSDLCDITKHMDEPVLHELLDGSYKYCNINAEKGKKPPVVNENLFTSVRKAFSILPHNCATDSNDNRKSAPCLMKPSSSSSMSDCYHNGKDVDESASTAKYPNLDGADLYQPKKVLESLVLPPVQDLGTLLSDLSMTSSLLKTTLPKKTCQSASLPPFLWSSYHNGACKPITDTAKQVSARNTSQGRWLRIASNSVLARDNQHCFSDLELLTFDSNKDPLQKSGVHQDDPLDSSIKLPYDGPSNMVSPMSTLESNTPDDRGLEKESCLSVSKRLNLMGEHTNSSYVYLEGDNEDSFLPRTSGSEASLKFQRKDSHSLDQVRSTCQFSNTDVAQKDQHTINKHCCSAVCSCLPCKDDDGNNDRNLWGLSTLEISKRDYSPCELLAAEILLEMTSYCSALKTQNVDGGKIQWTKTPFQKTMKPQKLISSMEKSGSLLFRTRHHDTVRTLGLPQREHKPSGKKNDLSYIKTAGRAPTKCATRSEGGASPCKLEKDLQIDARSLNNITVRSTSLVPSLARVKNGYENQQKLGKTTPPTSTVGACIKDWGRGRSKQV